MSEQEQFFEDCNHIGQGYICEHCVTAKLDAANAKIERLKAGYRATGFEGWPCPGCAYKGGVFISHCALHAEIEQLQAELRDERGLTDENYSKIELERNALKAQIATAEKRGMERAIDIACEMVGSKMWSNQISYATLIEKAIRADMEKL
jgi:hypothetical protein